MASVVFFHAHPDDEAISTGGTMALLADQGHRVVLVCATRGEVGEPTDGLLSHGEELGDRREAELRASCEILGAERLDFLGYRDSGMIGEATNDDPASFWQADLEEASARLAGILAEVGCDLLVGYDPNGTYGHPDHVKVHHVGARAAELAGVARVFWATANRDQIRRAQEDGAFGDEEFDADDRLDRETFGMPEVELTHAVDVRAVLDRKRASLAVHESQITEESFFLAMDAVLFTQAFGTEWFVDAFRHAEQPERIGELATSLFD